MGSFSSLPPFPQQLNSELDLLVEPEAVLGVRPSSNPTHPGMEVLIKWKNLPEHEALWESFVMIKEQFPEFHLGDKVSLQPGGQGVLISPNLLYI